MRPPGPIEDHDRGLSADLPLLRRRALLGLLAGAGLAAVAGCATAPSTGGGSTTASVAGCAEIPGETAGPFPGDGSNGVDVLRQDGIVRSDIRSSFGSASGVAAGVPLTVTLTMSDASAGCVPLAGVATYIWHCDRDGNYSLYSPGVTAENYLRGVQVADAAGAVRYTSIFPACYPGRWPHIHFEVYKDVAAAAAGGDPMATSQIALPKDACDAVYATDGYGTSIRHLSGVSLDSDNVFRDGWTSQLGTITGDVGSGLTVALAVPVTA